MGQLDELTSSIAALIQRRKKPLLVIHHSAKSSMRQSDVTLAYSVLRQANLSKEKPAECMDLLLDTYGGDPSAAYALAQMIRSLTRQLTIIVADHAYSAGTLLAFSGDQLQMADNAVLSPIDITLYGRRRGEIELATLDSFMEFARNAREMVEETLVEYPGKLSNVESALLVQMVKEIGALAVGKYYRERMLTGEYARMLLGNYLLKDTPDRADETITHFLFGAPAHVFHMDFYMCRERGLPVTQLATEESDTAKDVLKSLAKLVRQNIVCKYLDEKSRSPFIDFYPFVTSSKEQANDGTTQSSTQGSGDSSASAGDARETVAGDGAHRRIN